MDASGLMHVFSISILTEFKSSYRGLRFIEGTLRTAAVMFKEVVSLAIITGFVVNILYVPHPNSTSYTVAFILSLAAMAPFILVWKYWARARAIRAARDAHEDAVDLVFTSSAKPPVETSAPIWDLEGHANLIVIHGRALGNVQYLNWDGSGQKCWIHGADTEILSRVSGSSYSSYGSGERQNPNQPTHAVRQASVGTGCSWVRETIGVKRWRVPGHKMICKTSKQEGQDARIECKKNKRKACITVGPNRHVVPCAPGQRIAVRIHLGTLHENYVVYSRRRLIAHAHVAAGANLGTRTTSMTLAMLRGLRVQNGQCDIDLVIKDGTPPSAISSQDSFYNFEDNVFPDEEEDSTQTQWQEEVVDQRSGVAVDELNSLMLKIGISDAGEPSRTIPFKTIEALGSGVPVIDTGQDPSVKSSSRLEHLHDQDKFRARTQASSSRPFYDRV
ncbi:uncharacterized protein PAC_16160 [Phialocephala subalpina]|uniref:Uncharacterized protein n=1 Tax=Phialocephala subalpina TaxID=576137 RepID=A0A1L7XMK5_9HELO|nr:uncharacterized protein PAC_16160 [Phialocephala subalpina]